MEAAKREAKEELGIVAEEWIPLGQMEIDTSMVNCPVHLFVAKGLTFTETERESTENIHRKKMPLDEAIRLVLDSQITHSPSCILLLKAGLLKKQQLR
jgi:8-oxo-dGTP pyrophosphatase MutT (NUDIX family)